MKKSELLASRRGRLPRLKDFYARLGVPEPVPAEPPFARMTMRHVTWSPLEDRYPDAPKLFTDREHVHLPCPEEIKRSVSRPGRRAYRRYENVRYDRMLARLMEEIMDKEIALRVGDLPPVEWDPSGSVKWTKPLVRKLLDHIANGGTYLSFANKVGCSRAAVAAFARSEAMAPLVAAAAAEGVEAMAEAALEIAGKPCLVEEVIETIAPDGSLLQKNVRRRDQVDARKLAYQARMERLSKIAPNRYGDKPEAPESLSMAERIMKARARLRADKG